MRLILALMMTVIAATLSRDKKRPEWVKKVREENRELKRQLKQRESQQFEQQVLREKPTLDDHDYDSDAFEQDYAQWLTEKQQVDAQVHAERQKYQQYHERYKADVDAIKAKAPDLWRGRAIRRWCAVWAKTRLAANASR